VFFETLGIKWWYEPEGFSLRFDYKDFATYWDMTEDELLQAGVPQTFQHLDGKKYSYLPDFYLPELDYWLEIKGPDPTREEVEKAFMLNYMAYTARIPQMKKAFSAAIEEAMAEIESWEEAVAEVESSFTFEDIIPQGVYIIYGDVPWPFPQKGNIFGYGGIMDSGSTFLDRLARAESVAGESEREETKYRRSLLGGRLRLCWQECPLCLKVGVGRLGAPYCRTCTDDVAEHIFSHLAGYRVMGDTEPSYWREPPNPADLKAMKLTKDLMNLEFFTSGHKSPRLHKAYSAARSARFEHGESP